MNQSITTEYIFCFSLGNLKLGIFLKDINRVIRAVEVTPLPGSPSIVSGIININGKVIPVVNFRKRFSLKTKQILPSDIIIIVKTDNLELCLFADEIMGLRLFNENSYSTSNKIIPNTEDIVKGIAVIDDELILIHDINTFLSLNEEKQLKNAIKDLESNN